MSERTPITCTACKGEIVPGTLFCWRHASARPPVGEVVSDHGQLLWRATSECASRRERAVAVLLDSAQVHVRRAESAPRLGLIELEVGPPGNTGAGTLVSVRLTDLLDALLAGDEQVEASRSAQP